MMNRIDRTKIILWENQLWDSLMRIMAIPFVIVCGSICSVWKNNTVRKKYQVIEEGRKAVQEVRDRSPDTIDPKLNGKLVHVMGVAKGNPLDCEFGIHRITGIIKLLRFVEMYQWIEVEQSTEGQTSTGGLKALYEYEKVWSSNVYDSNKFYDTTEHHNPRNIPFVNFKICGSSDITVGSYNISSPDIDDRMSWYVPSNNYPSSIDSIPFVTKQLVHPLPIHSFYDGFFRGFYIGNDPNIPHIGDLRIKYRAVPEQMVSILGRQSASGSLTSYTGKSGGKIFQIRKGIHDANNMFNMLQKQTELSHALEKHNIWDWLDNGRNISRHYLILETTAHFAIAIAIFWIMLIQPWIGWCLWFYSGVRGWLKSEYSLNTMVYILFASMGPTLFIKIVLDCISTDRTKVKQIFD